MAGAVVAFCNKTRVLLQPRRAPHMQTSVCVAHFFTSIVRIARSIFDPVPPTGSGERGGWNERKRKRARSSISSNGSRILRNTWRKVFKVRSFRSSLNLVASPYPRNTVFNIGQFKGSLRWLEHWHCRSFSLTVIGSQ